MSDEESMGMEDALVRSPQPRGFPSVAQVVGVWREKFDEGILNITHFKEHWRLYVPQVLSLDPTVSCLDSVFDEENVQNILFAPLEEFICGGNPNEVFERIKRLDDPPTVCGRVFKMSEPTYNCRECGTDPTCVLCVDCFRKSEHRHHKYKMGTSNGGGCCDCGDTEAWKSHPYCSTHIVGTLEGSSSSCQLPSDMQERTRITFKAILHYAYQLLSIDHEPKLPLDLRLKEVEDDPLSCLGATDIYCTVLYNDETHTFDHVINTLMKVLKCSRKDAHDYVTIIDRDGRAVVKCSTFQYCSELKTEVERCTGRNNSQSLKVQVKHSHVIAHQLYAIKLLNWFQKILSCSKHFRQIFAEVLLEQPPQGISVLKGILQRDSSLWKAARAHWHCLFICGMLKEYESKKQFALVFTKLYGSIMKDFIRDDHDHQFSVVSLGVQIYTVRTIAHYLISKQDVLFLMFNTFLSECSSFIKDGRLEFQRNEHATANLAFRRAQSIIFDLHYLLSCVPEEWTDELREGFMNGFLTFLKILSVMQGVDSVTRQVGQHMEYEPEWETAFHLHIKLSSVITSIIEWCGSDRIILIKCYRNTLKKLHDTPCPSLRDHKVVQVGDHRTMCIMYDVSKEPVSIHLPLSRLWAGLHVQLEKYNLQFCSPELLMKGKLNPDQIVEPVLRTQVMIAQVHAGLWRRNGYSILHQIYFYHNVKCRGEMLNKDIILLQFGASFIESNDFLNHLLNKYELIEWAEPDFENSLKRNEEDSLRQTIMLVEEFLYLLIVIVSERYVVGIGKVTEQDCIKKEIIQQLCIRPLSHSELSKTLPENENYDTNIDSIIEEIATFQKPTTGSGKGLYHLKPEYYDQYNVFFYHYTKEDLSRSEETQRKRRKEEGQLDCCPPPFLPPLTEAFSGLVNLLQCDVILYIMQLVLKRACDLQARSFSESQLHRVLYLIGFALNEEQNRNCDYFTFTKRSEKYQILSLLEELYKNSRVESYRDFIKWTITKYKLVAAASSKLKSKDEVSTTSCEEKMDMEESPAQATEDSAEDYMKKEKERIAQISAERKKKIIAQMTSAQKAFIKENEELYNQAKAADKYKDEDMCWKATEAVEFPIALGRDQTPIVSNDPAYRCILCQEYQTVNTNCVSMVFGAYVQKSSVLKNDFTSPIQRMKAENLFFLQSSLSPSVFTSICGHVMHSTCWDKYFQNLSTKESRRTYRLRQPISFDIEKEEFLCPLCESLNNTVLPVLPPLANVIGASKPVISEQVTFESWITSLRKAAENKKQEIVKNRKKASDVKRMKKQSDLETKSVFDVPLMIDSEEIEMDEEPSSISRPVDAAPRSGWDGDEPTSSSKPSQSAEMEIVVLTNPSEPVSSHQPVVDDSVRNMMTKFTKSVYTKGLGVSMDDENAGVLFCWKSSAYTIHVVEQLLRNENRSLLGDLPTRHKKCIKSMVRLSSMQEICKNQRVVNSYAQLMLSLVFDCNCDLNQACILDWDPFGMLVSLVMSSPSLFFLQTPAPFPCGSVLDLYATRLMMLATITQILIAVDLYEKVEGAAADEETNCLTEYLHILKKPQLENVSTRALWKCVTELCAPFLRCCCIFFRYLTGVHPPECLKQAGGDTYENMCRYLGLPTSCKELMDDEQAIRMFREWTDTWRARQGMYHSPLKFESYFKKRPLITLPKDYSELINSVSLFTCPNRDRDDSKNPTLCLICGTMLCSQTYCCQTDWNNTQIGACTHHAYTCGSGAGIFLRIRECEILFLSCPSRGCFLAPPYLDEYGETDQGLKRGNPLILCEDRYKKLENTWLAHLIHEEVSRSLEASHTLNVIPWQSL